MIISIFIYRMIRYDKDQINVPLEWLERIVISGWSWRILETLVHISLVQDWKIFALKFFYLFA